MSIANATLGLNSSRKRIFRLAPDILVVLGILLSWVDPRFFFIAAVGFFGPGILSELGLISSDEFKQETRLRAAHQAFLMAGIFLSVFFSCR